MKRRRGRCGKRVFRDEVAAKLALAVITRKDNTARGEREQRAYRCPHHARPVWHLTHIKDWKEQRHG